MSWKDLLKAASFRGVPFKLETVRSNGAHRVAIHKYPLRNGIYAENLGQDADQFTIRAYLIGAFYIAQRDALLDAMRNPDAGTLILPTQGIKKVKPVEWGVDYDIEKGGIEYIDLTFTEAGLLVYPSQAVNTVGIVNNAANQLQTTLGQAFNRVFALDGFMDFVRNEANTMNGNLVTRLISAAAIRSVTPIIASEYMDQVSYFSANSTTLMATPQTFADQVATLVLNLQYLYPNPMNAYVSYQKMLNYGDDLSPITGTTANRKQQAANRIALQAVVKRAALIGMAQAASQIDFASYNDAVAMRDQLAGYFDDQILATGATDDDQSYTDLNGMRSAMVQDITTRAANLDRIRTVTLGRQMPALVESYNLYETTGRADEIVARNKVPHPGFLPAGQPLQVLIS